MKLRTSGDADLGEGEASGTAGVPTIEAGITGLSVSAPARTRRFFAEGGCASVSGIESRPGCFIRFGRSTEARIECAGMEAAATVHLFPGLVRREMVTATGIIRETLIVAPTLPLVVGQWSSGAESTVGPLTVRIAPLSGRAEGWVVLEADDEAVLLGSADERFAVGRSPSSGPIRVDADGSGAVRVTSEPTGSGGVVSLILSAGREREIRSAFSAARHLRGHAIRAASAPEGALNVRTTVPDIDEAVAWLGARVAGQCRRLDAGSEGAVLTTGLAAIATGQRDAIHDLLSRRLDDSGHTGDSRATYALLLARFASTFGDASCALRAARRLVEATTELDHVGRHRKGPHTGVSPLTRVAARHLSEALHHSAHPDTIATLRGLAAHVPTSEPAPSAAHAGGERHLPMLGRRRGGREDTGAPEAHAEDAARWIEGLLRGDPETPPPAARRADVRAAREACAAFRTDPDSAWATWRALLTGAAPDGDPTTVWDPIAMSTVPTPPVGADTNDADTHGTYAYEPDAISEPDATSEPDAGSPGESLTAELILGLVEGLLGVVPDAPAGRIRVAPRLPSHLTSFGVAGIRVGDATLGMRYERVASRHRFELVPETAPVPPFVVFEPAVPGPIGAIRIDDTPVELDFRREGTRSIVSVQLPLDGTRRLEIEIGPDLG